jgi:hypothetical protein
MLEANLYQCGLNGNLSASKDLTPEKSRLLFGCTEVNGEGVKDTCGEVENRDDDECCQSSFTTCTLSTGTRGESFAITCASTFCSLASLLTLT